MARGNYGQAILEQNSQCLFVTKQIDFEGEPINQRAVNNGELQRIGAIFSHIRHLLVKFAIGKVCEMFGVGVPLLSPYGFDILCFRSHLEFSMERCWQLGGNGMVDLRPSHCSCGIVCK